MAENPMRLLLLALLLISTAQRTFGAEPVSGSDKVQAARKILDAWHNDQPERANRFLHIVCWTPSDRELPVNYQPRLTRMIEHIRRFYAREMDRLGFGYEALFKINPRIICASGTGYGPVGPYAHKGGQDVLAQAMEEFQALKDQILLEWRRIIGLLLMPSEIVLHPLGQIGRFPE